eukprot:TRINITY_DN3093_c0_g2_i1.p1 TRINITY_DN3093_c0_g2~~TRINITY_DN3093_c0_g2_i1.p1  ORF type:complete len:1374 (+),score=137.79 TRINITY_DN3093_c0_g2_i1:95-4216(+)
MRRALHAVSVQLLLVAAVGSTVVSFLPGQEITLFPALSCDDRAFDGCSGWSCDTEIRESNVHLTDLASGDVLSCASCAGGSFVDTFSVETGRLKISGRGTVRDHFAKLRSVVFTTTAWGGASHRQIIGHVGHGLMLGDAHHVYEFFAFPSGADHTWEEAQTACATPANSFFGLVGYLATLTTEEEQRRLPDAWDRQGFLGGSDYGTESIWRWVTGPDDCSPLGAGIGPGRSACDLGYPLASLGPCGGAECGKGRLFATGIAPSLVDYGYHDFDPSQPVAAVAQEADFLATSAGQAGGWRAVALDTPSVEGYYCEWGGVGTACVDLAAIRFDVSLLASNVNECTSDCPTCGTCPKADQRCNDVDHNFGSFSNWQCVCTGHLSGSTYGGNATCMLKECEASCSTCENGRCGDESPAQICRDDDETPDAIGTWVCECAYPLSTRADSYSGGSKIGDCFINECNTTCSHCASELPLGRCPAGQACYDENMTPHPAGDWECRCDPPTRGHGVASAAECVLDECLEDCPTCAPIDACPVAQHCKDTDTSPAYLNSWVCDCNEPAQGRGYGGPAQCELDECKTPCSFCAGTTCSDKQQECVDDITQWDAVLQSKEDWVCKCILPEVGVGSQQVADCTLDECHPTAPCPDCENNACSAATTPQVCDDAEPRTRLTWKCLCQQPYRGEALTIAAVCTVHECHDTCSHCSRGACEGSSQDCHEPDIHINNDWECRCRGVLYGSELGKPAVCGLDECAADCLGCNRGTCEAAVPPQTCNDTDHGPASLGDWYCTCEAPMNGTERHGVAVCRIDECEGVCPTCEADACLEGRHQHCHDPDDAHLKNWECECTSPYYLDPVWYGRGLHLGHTVRCILDECTYPCAHCANDTCTAAGQLCRDTDPVAPHTWMCECDFPERGNASLAVADCTLDECEKTCRDCGERYCQLHTQACVDPNVTLESVDDWHCVCTTPYTTSSTTPTREAVCSLDECSATCLTCEKGHCAAAQQTCVDMDTAPSALSTWMCACKAPATALNVAALMEHAVCVLNECEEMCATCANSTCGGGTEQVCVDDDELTTGTWECRCTLPYTGDSVMLAQATCVDPNVTPSPTPWPVSTPSPPSDQSGATLAPLGMRPSPPDTDDKKSIKILLSVAIAVLLLCVVVSVVMCIRRAKIDKVEPQPSQRRAGAMKRPRSTAMDSYDRIMPYDATHTTMMDTVRADWSMRSRHHASEMEVYAEGGRSYITEPHAHGNGTFTEEARSGSSLDAPTDKPYSMHRVVATQNPILFEMEASPVGSNRSHHGSSPWSRDRELPPLFNGSQVHITSKRDRRRDRDASPGVSRSTRNTRERSGAVKMSSPRRSSGVAAFGRGNRGNVSRESIFFENI